MEQRNERSTTRRQQVRDLQLQFASGLCIMVTALEPLVAEWRGSMSGEGWFRLIVGLLGLSIAVSGVVKLIRLP